MKEFQPRLSAEGIHLGGNVSHLTGDDGLAIIDPSIQEQKRIEDLRTTVAEVRALNIDNFDELRPYFRFLTHPSNREHFANPPASLEQLKEKLMRRGEHPLIGVNMMGEVVGGATISDAEEGQHDHWITKVTVDPKLQNKGIGEQMMILIIDWAFSNPDVYGRERKKLDISMIRDVRGWERMEHLVEKLGFQFRMRLPEQVDVVTRAGGVQTKATHRWEMMRAYWQDKRNLFLNSLQRNNFI